MTRTNLDIAWAAGLFEGEGCVRSNQSKGLVLTLNMTDQDVVERFAQILGIGNITTAAPRRAHFKQEWRWDAGDQTQVAEAIDLLYPWLGKRRRARIDHLRDERQRAILERTQERPCQGCGRRYRPRLTHMAGRSKFCSAACAEKSRAPRRSGRGVTSVGPGQLSLDPQRRKAAA